MMKRVLDIVLSLIGLLLVSPVFIVLTLLIRAKLGSPVFFKQIRPGMDTKPFEMIKFRTMTNEKDEHGDLLPNEKRMTKFGMFLRSSSLDELPELINVLKGEMSLVGPRPLLMDYLPYFSEKQNRRHDVKPGITGWAQVNGRNAIGWDKKLELDVWYVENRTFWLDVKIILMTIMKVLKRDGITHEGHVAMPRFDEHVKQQRSGT
jgi:sugar transferase EpsL